MPDIVRERLALMFEWYRGMIDERTGRLVTAYDPEADAAIADGSPIRDIASVWVVERLGEFLGRPDLLPLVERSLRHYNGWLVPDDGALIVDSRRLAEASSIAHSAFLILSLLHASFPGRDAKVVGLVEGILRQQRADGSYRIHFGDEPDEGVELYPGEAMLALLEAEALGRDARLLGSVERGFAYYRDRFPPTAIAREDLVFYANWQSQAAALLGVRTSSRALATSIGNYVFALHDRVLKAGFYEDIERHPGRHVTVEVACALEGVNDAYAMAVLAGDVGRTASYERCIRSAVTWLLRAQRLDRCTCRERGGFGQSLRDRMQRIDVTGHVVGGLIKSARNGVVA